MLTVVQARNLAAKGWTGNELTPPTLTTTWFRMHVSRFEYCKLWGQRHSRSILCSHFQKGEAADEIHQKNSGPLLGRRIPLVRIAITTTLLILSPSMATNNIKFDP